MATFDGTDGDDTLKGTAAADYLSGGAGDDLIVGYGGDDTLEGDEGADTLKGGAGDDVYLVGEGDLLIDWDGFDTVIATDQSYTLGNGLDVLLLQGGGRVSGRITAQGNELDNTLRNQRTGDVPVWMDGLDGNDVLIGGKGSEVFTFTSTSGSSGDDFADGRGGEDTLFLDQGPVRIVEDGFAWYGWSEGPDSVTFKNIEVIATGSFGDEINVGADVSTIHAGGGDDDVLARAGSHTIHGDLPFHHRVRQGNSGNDWLEGGEGNDTIYGDGGRDVLHGDSDADVLVGGSGNDFLDGGAGDDLLHGKSGDDDLYLSEGSDTLFGGAGDDTLYWDGMDAVVDGGSGSDQLFVWVEGDLDLTAIADDRITGIEEINLSGSMTRLTLRLGASDLLALSDTSDTLTVLSWYELGSVDIVGAFKDLGISGDFHRYRLGEGFLLVDETITVT